MLIPFVLTIALATLTPGARVATDPVPLAPTAPGVPAPFQGSLDAGPDVTIVEGSAVTLTATTALDPGATLVGVSWDLDAATDADGNGVANDDADAAGLAVDVPFGDGGVFDVTATARVSVPTTNVTKVDQDVLFLIDSSGSMQWNDPNNDRLAASKGYVDQLAPDDRAAVISFDTLAFLVPDDDRFNPGDHLSSDYARVKANIDRVDSAGGTAFIPAFTLANKEFSAHGDPTHVWVAIFLTEGGGISIHDRLNFPKILNATAALGIRVFPIGLHVPPELGAFMSNIANVTGGVYYPSPDPSLLAGIYENISAAVQATGETIQILRDTVRVTVTNAAPAVGPVDVSAADDADVTLRVAGEKYHDVTATLYQNGVSVATATILRVPGSPDAQSASLGTLTGAADAYAVVVVYTPLDDAVNGQVNGADPAWLILTQNGVETRLHHTFNVRHPDTWTWTVDDLGQYLQPSGAQLTFDVSDPGSDDLTVRIDWGDNATDTFSFPNNASLGADPDPSPEVNPRLVAVPATHAYAAPGTHTVAITVEDDDGGSAIATFSLTA